MKKIVLIGLGSMIVLPSIATAQTMSPARHAGYPTRYQAQYNPAYQQQYPQLVPVAGQPMMVNGQVVPQQVQAQGQAQGQARTPQRAVSPKPYKKPKYIYASAHVGASWMNISEIENTTDTGGAAGTLAAPTQSELEEQTYAFSLALGYDLRKYKIPVRTELSFTYRPELDYNQNEMFQNARTPASHSSTIGVKSLMANIYYDISLTEKIKPFVGGGIGFSIQNSEGRIAANDGSFDVNYEGSNTGFSWNLMAGLSYQLTPSVSLEGMYKYSDLGSIVWKSDNPFNPIEMTSENATDHQLLIGAKYHF